MDAKATAQAAALCAVATTDLSPTYLYTLLTLNPRFLSAQLPPTAQRALLELMCTCAAGVQLHTDAFSVLVDHMRAPGADHATVLDAHRATVDTVMARAAAGAGYTQLKAAVADAEKKKMRESASRAKRAKRTPHATQTKKYALSASDAHMRALVAAFNTLPAHMRATFDLVTSQNTQMQSDKLYTTLYLRHVGTGMRVRAVHACDGNINLYAVKHPSSPLVWMDGDALAALFCDVPADALPRLASVLDTLNRSCKHAYAVLKKGDARRARCPKVPVFDPATAPVLTHAQAESLLERCGRVKYIRGLISKSAALPHLQVDLYRYARDGHYYFGVANILLLGWYSVGGKVVFATARGANASGIAFLPSDAVMEVIGEASSPELLHCLKLMAYTRVTPGKPLPTLDGVRVPKTESTL